MGCEFGSSACATTTPSDYPYLPTQKFAHGFNVLPFFFERHICGNRCTRNVARNSVCVFVRTPDPHLWCFFSRPPEPAHTGHPYLKSCTSFLSAHRILPSMAVFFFHAPEFRTHRIPVYVLVLRIDMRVEWYDLHRIPHTGNPRTGCYTRSTPCLTQTNCTPVLFLLHPSPVLRCTPASYNSTRVVVSCTPVQTADLTSPCNPRHRSRLSLPCSAPRSSLGSLPSTPRDHDDSRRSGLSGISRDACRGFARPLTRRISIGVPIRAGFVFGSILARRRRKWRSERSNGPPAEDDSGSGSHVVAPGITVTTGGPPPASPHHPHRLGLKLALHWWTR